MPILLGRDFDGRDREGASKTVVVNEALVRHYFRDQNPLGGRFAFEGAGPTQQYAIVGIVKDAKYNSLREETSPFLYLPFSQNSNLGVPGTLVVRTDGDPLSMVNAVRREVKAIAQNVPIVQLKTLDQAVEESLIQERLMARLSGSFGLLALLLACVGLYGVMSYAVARRTSEIGIRVALGAREQDVLWLVLRETLLLVTLGITIGLPVALASTRLISSRLFGLTPMDPVTISASTLLLAAVAALAGYLPARRAANVDPMVALRYE